MPIRDNFKVRKHILSQTKNLLKLVVDKKKSKKKERKKDRNHREIFHENWIKSIKVKQSDSTYLDPLLPPPASSIFGPSERRILLLSSSRRNNLFKPR